MQTGRQRVSGRPSGPMAALGLAGALLAPTIAVSQSVSHAELEGVRRELAREEGRLDEGRAERRGLEAELRQTEQDASVVIRRLRQLETALAARTAALSESRAARETSAAESQVATDALAIEVRATYVTGRADHLKMLLNQEDPQSASRALSLHGFVARARATRVARLTRRLSELRAAEMQLEAETRDLAVLTEKTAAARVELDSRRRHRAEVLARLDAELRDSAARIERLRRNEAELTRLLKQFALTPATPPPRALTGSERPAFASLAGVLSWPTRGSIASRFGALRGTTELKWSGIRIDSPAGEPVHAVAGGRIVWADWLRGFGQLIIIDHGEGYMSLYGHVRELLREHGDWVESGDVLGTVGDSGGQSRSGLYFEIRKDGRPRNPSRWFAGKRPTAAPRSGRT